MNRSLTIAAAAALTAPAAAQQPLPAGDNFAWGENIGYINFGATSAPDDVQFLAGSGFQGFAWGENVGWINLGAGNFPYTNTNNTNFGVTHDNGTNLLGGFAWGENIGWINFGPFGTLSPTEQARVVPGEGRLRGFAWGENVGWINFDDNNLAVQVPAGPCNSADIAPPFGQLDLSDVQTFLIGFGNMDPVADIAGGMPGPDGNFDLQDVQTFLIAFGAGCP